ncbi:MAG: winged helix-turn-helix transcriptional regulator [Bacteroidales bacterium]|nr:winged helix-turn-helix transcriptional regulator [Bacteroidales bacterium]
MSKIELFEKELQDTALLFKALAHPARLAILKYLAEAKVCISGDISNELPLSRTTVNQHLKELKEIGLIQGEIEGVKVNYCLNQTSVKNLVKVLSGFFENFDCCKKTDCCK